MKVKESGASLEYLLLFALLALIAFAIIGAVR